MKTSFSAAVMVLSLSVLAGCNDKSTPGGTTTPGNNPLVGQADGKFELTAPGSVPYATTVKQGEGTPFTIGISRGKNFDQDVQLKFEGLPTGVTVEPAGATIKHGDADAKLLLKAAETAPIGTVSVKVLGTNPKGVTAATEFKITVSKRPAYSVRVPSTSTDVQQGASKEVAITLSHETGFDEDVALKFEGLPPGVTIEPANPTVVKGQGKVEVNVKATPEAGLGEKTIKVLGHSSKGIDSGVEMKINVVKK